MRLPHLLLAISATARAQIDLNERPAPEGFWFTLTQPGDYECPGPFGSYQDTQSISIRVMVNFTERCYNIDDLFQEEELSLRPNNTLLFSCYWSDSNCTNEYNVGFPPDYDSSNNYSTIYWNSQDPFIGRSGDEDIRFENYTARNATMRVFEGRDCTDVTEDRPYRQFGNCEQGESADCIDLPFSPNSFQLLRTPEQNRSDGCLIAAVRGSGRKMSVGLEMVLAAVFGTALMLVGTWN